MKVEIYSDVACPWCYVGKHRFETALAQFPGREDVEVVMRPFQLDATLSADPAAAIPAREHYMRKFGPQYPQMAQRLAEVAQGEGIDYQADKVLVTNTLNAHRVIWLAEQDGGPAEQLKVAEAVFKAYFTEGRNVADPETLVSVAADAGLSPERVRSFLASDEGLGAVAEQLKGAHERGVSAVPTFVFEDRWVVQGAQAAEAFLQALEGVAANLQAEALTASGDACDDGSCSV